MSDHLLDAIIQSPLARKPTGSDVRASGRGHGRSRGRGRGGPAVAAISITDVQHMVDSLPGESSAFLPDKWPIDSGADLNICFNYELFSYIGPSNVDICTPIGSTPLDVLGRGVVKMCVGQSQWTEPPHRP